MFKTLAIDSVSANIRNMLISISYASSSASLLCTSILLHHIVRLNGMPLWPAALRIKSRRILLVNLKWLTGSPTHLDFPWAQLSSHLYLSQWWLKSLPMFCSFSVLKDNHCIAYQGKSFLLIQTKKDRFYKNNFSKDKSSGEFGVSATMNKGTNWGQEQSH